MQVTEEAKEPPAPLDGALTCVPEHGSEPGLGSAHGSRSGIRSSLTGLLGHARASHRELRALVARERLA